MNTGTQVPLSLRVAGWVCGVLGILVVPWALVGLLLGATLMPSIQALSNDAPPPPLGAGGVPGAAVAWCAGECLIGLQFAVFGFATAAGREWGRRGLVYYVCLAGLLSAAALAVTAVSLLNDSVALLAALMLLLACVAPMALLYLAFRWLHSPAIRAACARPSSLPPASPSP